MKIEAQNSLEHKMVELKAKVDNHTFLKKRLAELGAKYVGTFSQSDVYFEVPEGRLKLREVEGSGVAELIYYDREDIAGPKSDDAFLLKVHDSEDLKNILRRILKPSVRIEKVREIYIYNGTQIHLDTVTKLGRFIEFERRTADDSKMVEADRLILEQLMKTLEIDPDNLVTLSYSDLVDS